VEQNVEKWIADLNAAGWKRHATISTIWVSPWGAWYQGPYKAWQNIEFESKVNAGKEFLDVTTLSVDLLLDNFHWSQPSGDDGKN